MSMQLKDAAVFFDTSEAGLRLLELAAQLAARSQAHLIGLSSANDPQTHTGSGFARGGNLSEMIGRREQSIAAQLLRTGQALEKAAQRHDLRAEFRAIPYTQAAGEAALHALYCDLLIVSSPAVGAPLLWSGLEVMERTGVPLLMVPQGWRGPALGRHIVMAWNASRQARRALADALPLMADADTVSLLIVDAEANAETHGQEPGADIAAYLARHGVNVEVRRLDSAGRGVADTILEEASRIGADLVVFGAYSRSRLSERLFGGVTRTLLDTEQIPLFISH